MGSMEFPHGYDALVGVSPPTTPFSSIEVRFLIVSLRSRIFFIVVLYFEGDVLSSAGPGHPFQDVL